LLNVVLVNPEIPPNTGNIGRLTLGTRTKLHIVGEPNFDLENDKALKRAGLDYWEDVKFRTHADWSEYKSDRDGQLILATKFADRSYDEVSYRPNDSLIFGGETHGVPRNVAEDPDVVPVCLPMTDNIRSYNVCNTVAVLLFEALRQMEESLSRTPFSSLDQTCTDPEETPDRL